MTTTQQKGADNAGTDTDPQTITLLGIECSLISKSIYTKVYASNKNAPGDVYLCGSKRKNAATDPEGKWTGEVAIKIPGNRYYVTLYGDSADEKLMKFSTLEDLESHLRSLIYEYRRILDGIST